MTQWREEKRGSRRKKRDSKRGEKTTPADEEKKNMYGGEVEEEMLQVVAQGTFEVAQKTLNEGETQGREMLKSGRF